MSKAADLAGELTISLSAPGMQHFHRAGVAGLWMTLEAFDKDPQLAEGVRLAGGDWERGKQEVRLRWQNGSAPFFKALIAAAFRIDEHHLIHFPALGMPSEHPEQAVMLQASLLGTFLQHGKTRDADQSLKPGGTLVAGDGVDEARPLRFRRIYRYAHQGAAGSDSGQPEPWCRDPSVVVPIAGWQFPGGADRHVGLGSSTRIAEPIDRYLALLFAPVAAFYFQLRARSEHRRAQHCIVLPEVQDLEGYAKLRRIFNIQPVSQAIAAGGAQAALRLLVLQHAEGLLDTLGSGRCRVIEFGTVAWASQQKTRIGLHEVVPGVSRGFDAFRIADSLMPPRRVARDDGDSFWVTAQTPELVAENVLAGRPWWEGFATFVADNKRREAVLGRLGSMGEKKELAKMIEETSATMNDAEQVFVRACHEAWRRRMGRLGERAGREQLSFNDLVFREFEQNRLRLARCKDSATFRETITDFWSRSGSSLAPLQKRWQDILPFLDERQWRAGRDLALLALASYQAPAGAAGATADAANASNDTDE